MPTGFVGRFGYVAGPLVHVCDSWLCDPLLMRLPGPLTEIVLLGNVALRGGKAVTLDRPKLTLDDPSLAKYLQREYRRYG